MDELKQRLLDNMFQDGQMSELKGCPCCGRRARIVEHRFNDLPPTFGVECTGCSLSTWQFWGRIEDAERAWNTRVKEGEK